MRTKALSWGFVRVSVGFWVWVWVLVLGGGDGFCKRVKRREQFGDLNSSGFILLTLRCIMIETTRTKVEVWTLDWNLHF